jgi:hypothetical protein
MFPPNTIPEFPSGLNLHEKFPYKSRIVYSKTR